MLKKNKNRLTLSVPEDLPEVYANANEITQVVLNLITNSNNHTEGGEIAIGLKAERGELVVTVSDTGTGILPEFLPRVFERGVTDGGGAGIGLNICRQIIEAHGGEVGIESNRTGGTTVWFTLPTMQEGESGE